MKVKKQTLRHMLLQVAVVSLFPALLVGTTIAQPLDDTQISTLPYPKAFFFRESEWAGIKVSDGRLDYKVWSDSHQRLYGIVGKVLEEEIPGRSSNMDLFTRFKKEHPGQLVLLHYNGNARDPRDVRKDFFAGHWIYHPGTTTIRDLPAEPGESEIHVLDTSVFSTRIGRFRNKNDDIGICMLDSFGKPDWLVSEQVQLLSIDHEKKTIRVKRGSFNTKPLAFPAGRSYVASHATSGPFGEKSNLLWLYNFSTNSPRDSKGLASYEVLAQQLATQFSPNGELAVFDGIEFDVLRYYLGQGEKKRAPRPFDTNADGLADGGYFNGVNTYGLGVIELVKILREKLGESFIILADGTNPGSQRAVQWINGIESEGWPNSQDFKINGWSSGMNRHRYWSAFARKPSFTYINHKFINPKDVRDRDSGTVPYSTHRLVMGAAQLFDAFFTYTYAPPVDDGYSIGIWDELRKGRDGQSGWLGFPKGAAISLARHQPNLLRGKTPGQLHWQSSVSTVSPAGTQVTVRGRPEDPQLQFNLKDIPTRGPDLTIAIKMRALPPRGFPEYVPRMAWVSLVDHVHWGDVYVLSGPADRQPATVEYTTLVGGQSFESTFYFRDVKTTMVDLSFRVEDSATVWIESVEIYAYPEVFIREFDNGLVLVNPADHGYSFDLTTWFGTASFKKLTASKKQDSTVNDGTRVAGSVLVGPRDSLFLVRENPAP